MINMIEDPAKFTIHQRSSKYRWTSGNSAQWTCLWRNLLVNVWRVGPKFKVNLQDHEKLKHEKLSGKAQSFVTGLGAAGWRALPSRYFCEDARRLQSEGRDGEKGMGPKTPFGPQNDFFSGGWFGCHQFYVPIYKGFISSSRNWRSHIFQRGGPTQAPSSFSFSQNPRGIQDAYGWHGWQWHDCQDQSEMRDRHLKNEYMQDVVFSFFR